MISNVKVKYIGCDNSGENAWIKMNLRNAEIKSKVENMSPYTPQQNEMVESDLSYFYGNVRATLNYTDLKGF